MVTGEGEEGRKWEAGKAGEKGGGQEVEKKGREGYGNLAPTVVSKSRRLRLWAMQR